MICLDVLRFGFMHALLYPPGGQHDRCDLDLGHGVWGVGIQHARMHFRSIRSSSALP